MTIKTKRVLAIIFSIVGSVGVIATAALGVKAGTKLPPKLEELKEKTEGKEKKEQFTTALKTLAPVFTPVAIAGTATVVSIISSAILSKKIDASLSAATLLLDQGYRRYKNKVKEVLGIDKHQEIENDIAEDLMMMENPEVPNDGKKLYWNEYTGFFDAEPTKVIMAINNMNMRMCSNNSMSLYPSEQVGWCTLGQFVKDADADLHDPTYMEKLKNFGWGVEYLDDTWDDMWIYFGLEEKVTEDGKPYTVISFLTAEPVWNPDDYLRLYREEYIYAKDVLKSDKTDKDIEEMMSKEKK